MEHTPFSDLGWLVVGHGTRDPQGRAEFEETARLLAAQTDLPVEACYLELASPAVAEGVAKLARRGVRRLIVVPLLLFTAGHAKRDIPDEVAAAASPFGMAIVGQAGALERQQYLLELSRLRFTELLGKDRLGPDTRLLMVGRGGSDLTATAAMQAYTQEVANQLGVTGTTAFVALAEPSVPEMLEILAATRPRRVVVQPHLLFAGEVLAAIRSHVTACAEQHPKTQWFLAEHLGPHPLLVQAIRAKVGEVLPAIATRQPRF